MYSQDHRKPVWTPSSLASGARRGRRKRHLFCRLGRWGFRHPFDPHIIPCCPWGWGVVVRTEKVHAGTRRGWVGCGSGSDPRVVGVCVGGSEGCWAGASTMCPSVTASFSACAPFSCPPAEPPRPGVCHVWGRPWWVRADCSVSGLSGPAESGLLGLISARVSGCPWWARADCSVSGHKSRSSLNPACRC